MLHRHYQVSLAAVAPEEGADKTPKQKHRKLIEWKPNWSAIERSLEDGSLIWPQAIIIIYWSLSLSYRYGHPILHFIH